ARRPTPPPLHPRPATPAAAAHPPPADHRDHHQPAPARLDPPRTRDHARRPPPPPRHPTPRMVPARLLHPHPPGHLPAQHADAATILDKRTRPLSRCLEIRRCFRSSCTFVWYGHWGGGTGVAGGEVRGAVPAPG